MDLQDAVDKADVLGLPVIAWDEQDGFTGEIGERRCVTGGLHQVLVVEDGELTRWERASQSHWDEGPLQ